MLGKYACTLVCIIRSTTKCVTCVVLGQIRTAIGQAQLLVNKKLKQFLGLCENAEVSKLQFLAVCVVCVCD